MSQLPEIVVLAAAAATGRPPDRNVFPFVFVESIQVELWDLFAERPAEVGSSAEDWLAGLRRRGVTDVRLAIPGLNLEGELTDRRNFGFVDASDAFLLAFGPQIEHWRTLSRVGDRDAPDRRIWQMLLQGARHAVGADPVSLPMPTPVPIATANLLAALRDIAAYAVRIGVDASEFERAVQIGSSPADPPSPAAAYQGDWLPNDWATADARRLVRTAFAANVFRGMGSWNDVGPPDPTGAAEHEHLSQRLFVSMLDAIVAAVNSR